MSEIQDKVVIALRSDLIDKGRTIKCEYRKAASKMLKKTEHYLELLTLPLIYPAILGSLIFELIIDVSGEPTFAPLAQWVIVALYCLDYLVLVKWKRRTDILTQFSDITAALSFKASSIYVLSNNYCYALICLTIVSLTMGLVIWRSNSDISFKWVLVLVGVAFPTTMVMLSLIPQSPEMLSGWPEWYVEWYFGACTEFKLFLWASALIALSYGLVLWTIETVDSKNRPQAKND